MSSRPASCGRARAARTLARAALSMGGMLVREPQGWDQDAFDHLDAAINSGFPKVVGPAQLIEALMADRIGDRDLAEFCYREAAHGAVPHAAAQAAFHLGDMLRARGDVAGARAQFAAAARAGDPEFSGKGALDLGVLIMERARAPTPSRSSPSPRTAPTSRSLAVGLRPGSGSD
ncbi:hypothetical protein ACIGXI_33930 [Kitasatospora aureofaciens]|uniref:hypothetical protein n=1 Tax=Kitasatospora aureofaciens TaxID=1894 RepID=UPI0037C85D74